MDNQKLALVTGGNRGIGNAVVRGLCERGVRTLFTCRNPHDGQLAMMEMATHARLLDFHPLELSENQSVETLVHYVTTKYGYLDILINNAAVNYDNWQRVSKVAMAEVEYTMDVNLLGPWRMCNNFIPLLKARENSRIINVSSGAGSIENLTGETPAYSLSKNGLNMLTISLAADLADDGIAVNAADPGWVRTELGGENAPNSAEEGADTIIWLALDAPQKLTGGFFRNRTSVSW
ncbi:MULTISPECIES: SDR family NAD(P)-dependent oxidoreductase [Desulfosediminicola]|uniref:SDR family NAD(P)-dependent oxidoreductase n=1 Tax=Desulfosediminicola TaxID=2886823 RepID=UPI0010ABDC3C|nr:SDR family NAD(P)-dependent oxidoreductase [Desulfosediminicola ganghwensis]